MPQVIVFKLSFPVWNLIYKAVAGVQSDAWELGVLECYEIKNNKSGIRGLVRKSATCYKLTLNSGHGA